MHRLAAFILAVLVLAPAGLAATPVSGTTSRLDRSPVWPLASSWRGSTSGVSAVQRTALENSLLRAINDVRREHGLRTFVYSSRLATAAAQHTREMGTEGYFEHESYDSTPFWKRIERSYPSKGWRYWAVGENLLYSSPDVTATDGVDMWMKSPPHRANLLSRTWREIGISAVHFESAPGEYDGGPVTIVTADFGSRR